MPTTQQQQQRKRQRSSSPVARRGVGAAGGSPPSPPLGSAVGLPFRPSPRNSSLLGGEAEPAGVRAARVQVLQDVLRRTSLTELRDREIVEWLSETEGWLLRGEAAFGEPRAPLLSPPPLGGTAAIGSSGSTSAATTTSGPAPSYHFPGAAELRLLVLGVLHTMPWWRVVESVDTGHSHPPPSSASASRRRDKAASTDGAQASSAAAVKAVTRWHEKIQVGFERVCLVLLQQSQHTVPGVLEVVMRPFHLRPPVRDGARRAIPTDSFLRIVNAIATLYSATYTLELLKTCLDTLLPKRRWPDRRHHLASTAMLLHLALESLIPGFQANTGNAHSLERAQELMMLVSDAVITSARTSTTAAAAAAAGEGRGNADESRPASTWDMARHPPGSREGPDDAVGGELLPLQLPVSSTQAQELLQQPPPSSSDADGSDSNSSSSMSSHAGDLKRAAAIAATDSTASAGNKAFFAANYRNSSLTATPRTMLVQMPSQFMTVAAASLGGGQPRASLTSVPLSQNNRMLACRTDIIRFLLRRLLDMELALEGDSADDGHSLAGDDFSDAASLASTSFSGTASSPWWAPHRYAGGGRSFVARNGTAAAAPGHHSSLPSPHVPQLPDGDAASSAESPRQQGVQDSCPSSSPPPQRLPAAAFSALLNRQTISAAALPFLRILTDCTQLTFLMLAEDLRRQQAAGVCGNTDWWREVVIHFLHAVRQVERPKCLLFLAPSLAMLGNEDQPIDLLHKLISLVTKGYMPSLGSSLPSSSGPGAGAADRGGHAYGHALTSSSSVSSQLCALPTPGVGRSAGVMPMRMRMAHQPSSLAPQPVPMRERLRAAMFLFPLFRFMQEKIGSIDGARRRLIKWASQEMRKGHYPGPAGGAGVGSPTTGAAAAHASRGAGGGHLSNAVGSSVGERSSSTTAATNNSLARHRAAPSRLVEVVVAQCAAMTAAIAQGAAFPAAGTKGPGETQQQVSPSSTPPILAGHHSGRGSGTANPGTSNKDSDSHVSLWEQGGLTDEPLRSFMDQFLLHHKEPHEGSEGEQTTVAGGCVLDLPKMEREGLLRPSLMDGCLWGSLPAE